MNGLNLQYEQEGMTLIEILIALVLGIFLLGGVLEIFTSSNQSSRMLENLSRMQENGRFAMDFITRDLRRAGKRAHITGTSVCMVPKPASVVSGSNDVDVNDSDRIAIRTSDSTCPIVPVLLTYYIANGASGRPSLFSNEAGDVNEMVEDIDKMTILYGADSDGDNTPNYYVPAGTAGLDMGQVVSVRVVLTAKSVEAGLSNEADGRLKRTFASTITLRNRLP